MNKGISEVLLRVPDTVQDIEHALSLLALSKTPDAKLIHAYWLVLPDVFGFGTWSKMLFCFIGV